MAQQQRQTDIHQDELCLPNKHYAIINANKKIDIDNLLCPNESKILANILQNHPLRFNIASSSSVPWIYLWQFWHTLKEDGSKYRLKFVLDKKELTMTLDDFGTIFQLPQVTENNHEHFVVAPKFIEMALCKMFSRCLTTQVTGYDQLPLQIMQMLYCFVNNIHVNYADLLWEGLHYLLEHPTTLIPYARFTKLIVSHYMTAYPEISKRVRDKYHNLKHYEMVKRIFISGNNKAGVEMMIPSWMITDEMKLTENYRMYPEAFGSENLMAKEIEKFVEGMDNVGEDEVDKVKINVEVQPVNTIEGKEESVEDDYELRRRKKGNNVEETRNTPIPTTIRSTRIHSTLLSLDIEKLQELTVNDPPPLSSTPSSSSSKLSAIQRLLSLFKPKTGRFKQYKSFFNEL
ncbi:hypothetical protein Tco_0434383 [Tanacetum coccineum]